MQDIEWERDVTLQVYSREGKGCLCRRVQLGRRGMSVLKYTVWQGREGCPKCTVYVYCREGNRCFVLKSKAGKGRDVCAKCKTRLRVGSLCKRIERMGEGFSL